MECSSCCKDDFEVDDHAGRVCTNCGVVAQDVSLSSLTAKDGTERDGCEVNDRNRCYSYKHSLPLRYAQQVDVDSYNPPPGKKLGDQVFGTVLSKLRIKEIALKEEARELFEKVYKHKEFLRTPTRKKEALPAVCIYFVCRRYQHPITIEQMCHLIDCDIYLFGSIYKKITTSFNLSVPQLTIEEIVPSMLSSNNFSDEVIKRTSSLVLLCKESVTSVGEKNISSLVSPACLIAQKSLDVTYRKMSMRTFLEHYKLPGTPKTSIIKYLEIRTFMVALAKHIPWINSENVNINNVYAHLIDILDYKRTLLNSISNDVSLKKQQCRNNKRHCNVKDEEVLFKRHKTDHSEDGCNSKITERDLLCEDISEGDMPDSEVDTYIRTDEEIQNISNMKETQSNQSKKKNN